MHEMSESNKNNINCYLEGPWEFFDKWIVFFFRSATTTSTMTLQGLDLIFQMIVEDKDPSWQFTMGRLVALEHVLTLMKVESAQAGIALDFSLHNLSNGHSRVAKMALKVFVLSAKLLTSSEPTDFEQVWKLILTLPDPTLQLTLRKKLKIALR